MAAKNVKSFASNRIEKQNFYRLKILSFPGLFEFFIDPFFPV
jgi:hypothetical protein